MTKRTETIETLEEIYSYFNAITSAHKERFQKGLRDALELLKEQQPKKGHWQPYKYGDDTWHQCSVCGIADKYINIVKREGYPDYRMVSKRNFCPICGADMRKDGGQK